MGQVKNFMLILDEWAERSIIEPLADAYQHGPEEVIVSAKTYVKRAIREKVLESYHNGQKSAPRGFQRPIGARK
ncbi:MAG: hypothetical protein M3362_19890 [Acidobacteriota bacterium]|nr:hypothetical protein [Acidobacteriota bacterium]